ncbi:hypothetical protein WJ971_18115 [Achromobacter xylosoxidans]
MLEVDKKREATASIRGYFYQLDAALLEILNAGLDESVVIEGIEDFDRYTDDGVIYGQVKYYAEQNLTDSVLRDPCISSLFISMGSKKHSGQAENTCCTGTFQKLRSILVSFPSSASNR